jgi:hypothetical protein
VEVTINAPANDGSATAGDYSFTNDNNLVDTNWVDYGFAPGELIHLTDGPFANPATGYTIASIAGDKLYFLPGETPPTSGTVIYTIISAPLITGQAVSLTSSYNIGTASSPIVVNAGTALSVDATATTPSSANIYVNNVSSSSLSSVGVSTYGGSATIQSNGETILSFANSVLSEPLGNALVDFTNTENNGGSADDVILSGTVYASSISAGLGADGRDGPGQILEQSGGTLNGDGVSVLLNAGSGIGTAANSFATTDVAILDAMTKNGGIYVQNTAGSANALILCASTSAGSIAVQSTGEIVLSNHNDLINGGASSGTAGSAVLDSVLATGSVTLAAGSTVVDQDNSPISAGTLYLTSGSGIGTASSPLVTSVATLAADSGGGLFLTNNKALTVDAATAAAGGTLSISAVGNVTLVGNVSAGAATLTATAGALVAGNASAAGAGTTSNTSINTTGQPVAVTPATMASYITVGAQLLIDAGLADQEAVTVRAVTSNTFTATFAQTHTSAGGFTINPVAPLVGANSLIITAEQIGATGASVQTLAPAINVTANYGGIYLANTSNGTLTLTAAAVGPASGGAATNNIDISSGGNIVLSPQTTALTQLATPNPVALFSPGGSLTLAAGSASSTITSLGSANATTSNTVVYTVGKPVVITPVSWQPYIAVGAELLINAGQADQETVTVSAVTQNTSFTATFARTHAGGLTISPVYVDIYTGTYQLSGTYNTPPVPAGTPFLLIQSNTPEVSPPPPGGNSGPAVLLTSQFFTTLTQDLYQYQTSAGLAQLQSDIEQLQTTAGLTSEPIANVTIANGTITGGTVTLEAGAITIGDLGQNGNPGTVSFPNGYSLVIDATSGNIVFLNLGDTIATTGTGTVTVEAGTGAPSATNPEVAALGNLHTTGGNITISAGGNIAVGTLSAGSGTVSVTSPHGAIFSNGTTLGVTASALALTEAAQPTGSTQAIGLAQLNATEAIAAADAASAQAAAQVAADQAQANAELASANAFQKALASLQTTVAADQQTYLTIEQAVNSQSQVVGIDQGKVTSLTSQLNQACAAEAGLWVISGAAGVVAASVGTALAAAVSIPGSPAFIVYSIFNLGAQLANLASAIACAVAAGDQIALTTASNTLSLDTGVLTTDQFNAAQAYAQWQADMNTETAFAAAHDVAEQAYTNAEQTMNADVAASAQVQAQGATAQATAIAQVVFADPPQPMSISGGPVAITYQGPGMTLAQPISATGAGAGVTISSNSPLTVNANVTAPAAIVLQAQAESPPTTAGDDLTVNSGATIQSTGSSVSLTAGNNVIIPAGATIDAVSTITITGDENDLGGANVTVDGTLVAQSALIDVPANSPGNDTFTITPSATTPLTVTGGQGTNTLNLNAGGLAVSISGNTISVAGMKPVTFTNIQFVKITNAAGGGSLTLMGLSGKNTLTLLGTGQGAGTATLNGLPISFSGMTSFSYQGGGAGDAITVTPFVTSHWNLPVTVDGGSGSSPASLTYNSVGSLADTVSATGANAGSIASQGQAILQFANVNAITTNASPGRGDELTVNLPDSSSTDTASLSSVGNGTATINFAEGPVGNSVGLFGLNVDTADYAGLTINGNTVGGNSLNLVTSAGAGLSIPLTLNYPGAHSVVNTGTATSVEATVNGDGIGVGDLFPGVVEVTDLFGNLSEFAVTDTQLVFSDLGNKDTINVVANHLFTNGIDVNGNASFSDVLNYTPSLNAAVTVTPGTSSVSQAGAGAVYYAGVQTVKLQAPIGSTSALTVNGAATAEAFNFSETSASAGSFTVAGPGVAINTSPLFTYAGFGSGVTVDGGTSLDPALQLKNLTGNLATVNGYSYVNESVSAAMALTNGQYAGLVARYSATGHQSTDAGFVLAGSNSYTAYIYSDVNGVVQSLFQQTYNVPLPASSTLIFSAAGSSLTLSLSVNGQISQLGSAADMNLAHTAGSAGMWTSAGAVMSNFVVAPVTPVSLQAVRNPVSARPKTPLEIVVNRGPRVAQGGAVTISSKTLRVTDPHHRSAPVTYTITALPAHGVLLVSASPATVGTTFTQRDINLGHVRYQNDGSATTADSFEITAADSYGDTLRPTTVAITVKLASHAPTLVAHSVPVVRAGEGGTTVSGLLAAAGAHDGDVPGVFGLAVTATTGAGWQYSTDSGTTWVDLGAVAASQVLLLDGAARLRRLPGSTGPATLTFRAWDGTQGVEGGTDDLSAAGSVGGNTAFSQVSVKAVWKS